MGKIMIRTDGKKASFATVNLFFNHININRFNVSVVCSDRREVSDFLIKIAMNPIFSSLTRVDLSAKPGRYIVEIESNKQFILHDGILEVHNG